MRPLLLALSMALLGQSCTTVAAWQRGLLEQEDMVLEDMPCAHKEHEAEAYREGLAGTRGGTALGGCGCR